MLLWRKQRENKIQKEEEKKEEEKVNAKELSGIVGNYLEDEKDELKQSLMVIMILVFLILALFTLVLPYKIFIAVAGITLELILLLAFKNYFEQQFSFEKAYLDDINNGNCHYKVQNVKELKKTINDLHIITDADNYVCEHLAYMETKSGDSVYVIFCEGKRPFVVNANRDDSYVTYRLNYIKDICKKMIATGIFMIGFSICTIAMLTEISDESNKTGLNLNLTLDYIIKLYVISFIVLLLGIGLILLARYIKKKI